MQKIITSFVVLVICATILAFALFFADLTYLESFAKISHFETLDFPNKIKGVHSVFYASGADFTVFDLLSKALLCCGIVLFITLVGVKLFPIKRH